jgi:hypothetical protein
MTNFESNESSPTATTFANSTSSNSNASSRRNSESVASGAASGASVAASGSAGDNTSRVAKAALHLEATSSPAVPVVVPPGQKNAADAEEDMLVAQLEDNEFQSSINRKIEDARVENIDIVDIDNTIMSEEAAASFNLPKEGAIAAPIITTPAAPVNNNEDELGRDFSKTEKTLKAEKLALHNGECSKITDYLYVSGRDVATGMKDKLLACGITHVVNATAVTTKNAFESDGSFVYLDVNLYDNKAQEVSKLSIKQRQRSILIQLP